MKFLDAEFVQGFIRMADDGWQQGWHERNGGNLSYRVKPEEVELVKENFEPKEFQPIGTEHIDDILADLEAGFAAVRGK